MDIKKNSKKSAFALGLALALAPSFVFADDLIIESSEPNIGFFNNYVEDNGATYDPNSLIINDGSTLDKQYITANICMYAKVFSNIYSNDTTNADVITQIKEGDFVQVVGEDVSTGSSFYKVKCNGKEGFIAKTNVTPERVFRNSTREVVVTKATNLFSDKTLSTKAGSLKVGEKIKLSAESADIFEITRDDKKLYFLAESTTGNKVFKKVDEDAPEENKKIINKEPSNSVLLSPDGNSEVVTILSENEEVEKIEENGEWAKVQTEDNEVGYIKLVEIKEEDRSKIGGGEQLYNSSTDGQAVVDEALKYVGNRYVWGGSSLTNGTDCSGFTKLIYAKFGYNLPRYSGDQRYVGRGVKLSEAQPGDIICYPGHVAIYMGNERIVHASTPRSGIKTGSVYIGKRIVAVRRIIN